MTVTWDDIAVTLLRSEASVSAEEQAAWDLWIEDARRAIERRLGDLDALDQSDLDFVVREAVALKAKRPDSATEVSVSIDDASTSRRYESSTGQVTILGEWWELLSPANDSAAGFSTRPGFEPDAPVVDSWA